MSKDEDTIKCECGREFKILTVYQMTPEQLPEHLTICISCAKDSLTGIQSCGWHPTGHHDTAKVRQCEGWEPRTI